MAPTTLPTAPTAPDRVDDAPFGSGRHWWRNRRVGTRLVLGFSLLAALLLAIGVVSIGSQSRLAGEADALSTDGLGQATAVDDLSIELLKVRVAVFRHLVSEDAAAMDQAEASITAADARLDELVVDLEGYLAAGPAQQDLATFRASLERYRTVRDTVVLATSRSGDKRGAVALANREGSDALATALTAADALTAHAHRAAADLSRAAQDGYHQGRLLSLGVLAFGLVVAVIASVVITRSVTGPVRDMVGTLARVADGDLRARSGYRSNDEIGQMSSSLNHALASTGSALAAVGTKSDELLGAAGDLAAIATELSATAAQTTAQTATVSEVAGRVSASVQSVAASTEELEATVDEIAHSSADAAGVAHDAVVRATSAREMVDRLGRSSAEISQVISLITGIAEQTNLLALNATIEAARAGEAGRGFAVVASEVKGLAQETSAATATIRSTVDSIRTDTESAIAGIESIADIIVGVNDRQLAIAGAVEEQSATTSEVARTVTEAALDVNAIADNIGDIAEASDANNRAALDARDAASRLTTMASDVQHLLARFRY